MNDLVVVVGVGAVLGLGAHVVLSRRAPSSSNTAPPSVANADKRGPAALGYGYDNSTPETNPEVLGFAGASLASQYQTAALIAAAGDAGIQ